MKHTEKKIEKYEMKCILKRRRFTGAFAGVSHCKHCGIK